MRKINKIRVMPLVKIQTILMTLAGLNAGIFYSFGGAIYDVTTTGSLNFGSLLAFGALIGMPIIFAAFGFISAFIEAFIYNTIANLIGGIEIEIE